MFAPPLSSVPLVAFCVALACVIIWDVKWRRIPNALLIVVTVGGLAHAFAAGGWRALGSSSLGMVAGIALLYFQFAVGWMGAGDVKLLGAIGAVTGPLGSLTVLLTGSVLGGFLSLFAMSKLDQKERQEIRARLLNVAITRDPSALPPPTELSHRHGIPYGVPLALAAAGLAITRAVLL